MFLGAEKRVKASTLMQQNGRNSVRQERKRVVRLGWYRIVVERLRLPTPTDTKPARHYLES
jgi:hypothetical protein